VKELSSLLQRVSRKDQQNLVEGSVLELATSVMNGFDKDRNQQISYGELLDRVGDDKAVQSAFHGWKQGFLEADKDSNGQLDLHELASLLEKVSRSEKHSLVEQSEDEIAATVMDGFDSDRNGKISMRELVNRIGENKDAHAAFKGWQQGFMEADTDRDGQLDVKELSSLLNRVSRKGQQDLVQESELGVAATVLDGLDADRDGKLSLFELLDHAEKTGVSAKSWREGFKKADNDNDMHLNIEELASLFKSVSRQDKHELVEESEASMAASLLKNIDRDGDGKITFQEMRAHIPPSVKTWSQGFYDADVDQDGMLDVAELTTILKSLTRPEQHHMAFDAVAATGKVLEGFDANADGKLSMQEIAKHSGMLTESFGLGAWKEGFLNSDLDRDGLLDFQELHALLEAQTAQSPTHDEI
jgi:Ca2+-binding EF-hand superfamily protein